MSTQIMEYLGSPAQAGVALRSPLPAAETAEAMAAVENAVDAYFSSHAEKIVTSIRARMEEVQAKILDGLCQAVQTRYVQRIEALEASTDRNNATLSEIRVYARRADDDLRRLAAGISGLIEETTKVRETHAAFVTNPAGD
jgi:hypothetical protein